MSGLGNVKLDLVQTVDDAMRMMRWLGERHENDAIGFDLETGERPGRPTADALSPWHGHIRLAQIGDEHQGWAVAWDEWAGLIYEILEKWQGDLLIHNAAFEAKWMALQSRWDFPWHKVRDTMIAAQVINPAESAALKTLTSKYVDSRAAAMQSTLDVTMTKNGWTWGTVPITFGPYWQYGALDPVITCHLWGTQKGKVTGSGPYACAYDLEMGARRVATMMELNGARVDLDYCHSKYDELHEFGEKSRGWVKDVHGISIGSNVQLARTFLDMGVEWPEDAFTTTGQPKVDKDQLTRIKINYPGPAEQLADVVLKQRKADKLATTYFQNLIERNIDGIVHPQIRTMGARTGRMSIADPALQTLPKGEAVVRRAFIAKDDDHAIVTSDLDQVEFRMFTNLTSDPKLVQLFKDSDADTDPLTGDAFTWIMREIYNDPSANKKDKRRKLVKSYIYGRLYGAGVAKQALTAGIPEAQMKAIADAFDSNYPGVGAFTRQIEDLGMRRLREEGEGYVKTQYGRRLPCDEGRVYTLVNYLIQGSAAEVFKNNLLKMDAEGLTQYMIVPVHDEIVTQVPKTELVDVMPVIKDCMTTTEGYDVPLTSGIDGPFQNWGEGIE